MSANASGAKPATKFLTALFGLAAAGLLFSRMTATTADPDLWGYLDFGRRFWTGPFPYQDIHAYTPTKDLWVYHEWLTGVIYYKLSQLFGLESLQVLKYLAGIATSGCIYLAARLRGAGRLASLAGAILCAAMYTRGALPARAQVFTYLFFAVALYVLEYCRLRKRYARLWLLPPLFVVWANMHGGFVVGLLAMAAYAAGTFFARGAWRPFTLALAGSALATLVNPYGPAYWTYLIDALSMRREYIAEWIPLHRSLITGHEAAAAWLFLGLALLCLLFWLRYRGLCAVDGLLLAGFALASLRSARFQMLFFLSAGMCMPAVYDRLLAALGADLSRGAKRGLAVLAGAAFLILAAGGLAGAFRTNPFAIEDTPFEAAKPGGFSYPVAALDFVMAHRPQGNMVTEFGWGEYVLWKAPDMKLAMDGRYETVYADEAQEDFFAFNYGQDGWERLLEKYPTDIVLIRRDSAAYPKMRGLAGWKEVFTDAGSAVFFKTP